MAFEGEKTEHEHIKGSDLGVVPQGGPFPVAEGIFKDRSGPDGHEAGSFRMPDQFNFGQIESTAPFNELFARAADTFALFQVTIIVPGRFFRKTFL